MFQYKIYEENDVWGLSKYRLKDLYEDRDEILFVQGNTEYVFDKNKMLISYNNSQPRKCRYL